MRAGHDAKEGLCNFVFNILSRGGATHGHMQSPIYRVPRTRPVFTSRRRWQKLASNRERERNRKTGDCRQLPPYCKTLFVVRISLQNRYSTSNSTLHVREKRKACMHVLHACTTISNTPPYLEMNGDELRAFFPPA